MASDFDEAIANSPKRDMIVNANCVEAESNS